MGFVSYLEDKDSRLVERRATKAFVADITALDDYDQRKVEGKRRFAYVKALIDSGITKASKESRQP